MQGKLFRKIEGCFTHFLFVKMSARKVIIYRSNHLRCSIRKGVLKNFAKFTGKHLRQSLFFKKSCGPLAYNFFEKETLTQFFSCELCEIF